MSHSVGATDELGVIADELRETFEVRGHHVGVALDQDACFREGENPRSTLARALAKAGIRLGVAKAPSVGMCTLPGGARELRLIDGNVDRRYRVRRAKVHEDGSYVIEAKDDSIMQLDGESFYREERWVYAYTLSDQDLIDQVFVAEILGVTEGSPGRLILGTPLHLGGGLPPTRGFTPTTEDLDGFEDGDEGLEEDLG